VIDSEPDFSGFDMFPQERARSEEVEDDTPTRRFAVGIAAGMVLPIAFRGADSAGNRCGSDRAHVDLIASNH